MKKINLKKRFAKLFTLFVIAGTVSLAVSAQGIKGKTDAIQMSRCSERTIAGSYGHKHTGTFFVSPTTGVPLASVGQTVFDGTGGVSGTDYNSFGGTFGAYTFTGTYTVNADCTGTLDVTLSPGGFVINNKIVVVDNGKEILVIETNPGAVVSGSLKRQ